MAKPGSAAPVARDFALLAGVIGLFGVLTTIASSTVGFWEPWETAPATLGRFLATDSTQSVFAPIRDGALVARPWLETMLLKAGFALGAGSEAGFRMPFAMLLAAAAFVLFGTLRPIFGTRAVAAVACFLATPAAYIGAIHLGGQGEKIAAATIAVAVMARGLSRERASVAQPIALGAALGLAAWAGGAMLLSLLLFALAIAIWSPSSAKRPFMAVVAAVTFAATLGAAAIYLAFQGGFFAVGDRPGSDADTVRIVIFSLLGLALPASLALAGSGLPTARGLRHPVGIAVGFIVLALAVILPLQHAIAVVNAAGLGGEGLSPAVNAFFFPGPYTGRVLPDHVTFDVVIRLGAYSAYPLVALVPFAFGWALARVDDSAQSAQIRTFTVFAAVAFCVAGLGVSISDSVLTGTLALPFAVMVGLALTDRSYLASFADRRAARYAIGLASLLLLVIMSKDVRGAYNKELGHPGPQVIFEAFLLDGRVEFPSTYLFTWVDPFFFGWALLIAGVFFEPVANTRRALGAMVANASCRVNAAASGRISRIHQRMCGLGLRITRPLHALATTIDTRFSEHASGTLRAVAAVVLFGGWTVVMLLAKLPEMTNHFSQKGMLDRYEAMAADGEVLYTAGMPANDNSYYLGDPSIERLREVDELRSLFCESDHRIFAVIPAGRLADAYFAVKSEGDDPECPPHDLWVVDGRSSRYLLVSNELHTDRGEADESVINANVFTDETLPDTVVVPETRVRLDDQLELAGVEITPSTISSGKVTVSAYWRVLATPPQANEIFIHVDFRGNRINGDHKPVGDHFPTNRWIPGEIVRDSHDIEVSRADRAGDYTVWYGFFRGDTRMRVDPAVGDNRVNLGRLTVAR